MKIKFATPEMANFTGMFGAIEFADGVSVNEVTMADVNLYRAITTIEVLGEDFVPEKSYDEIKNIAAVSYTLPTNADEQRMAALAAPVEAVAEQADFSGVVYTQADLEAIADKDGIAGVREIAEKMNIRGTSISKLIAAILATQPAAPSAGFIASPGEDAAQQEPAAAEPADQVPAEEVAQ